MGELKRSRDNKMISGVFAGISKKYGWDLSLLRLAYVAIAFFSAGLLPVGIYIAAAIIIPEEDITFPRAD